MMATYLLDTNHLSHCINRVSRLRERIHQSYLSGNRFGTIVPVLCEFEVYALGSRNPEGNYRALRRLARYVKTWPLEPEIAAHYGRLYLFLRSSGRHLSQVDIMTAASAIRMNCTLLTTDRDFEALPELKCENWLI